MGEVYEAEHRQLGKRVVVKLLRPELARDPSLVERLQIEAKVMARLDNPHIVAVHDLGTTPAGRTYFVQDYLSGRTVAEEMKARGPFSLREAIRIVLAVLDGLSAAHAAGLVHRDIKPPNVFLCDPDRRGHRAVKILDFGVVKVSPARMERSFPTEQGQFIGSPAVASPEQVQGRDVDARADLYATGLLLYILIAGKSPFPDANVPSSALWAHVLTVPPPLSTAAPVPVPPLLDMLIATALAKEPTDRYASAAHMAAALERIAARLPASEPPRVPVRPAGAELRGSHGTVVEPLSGLPASAANDTAEMPTLVARGAGPPPRGWRRARHFLAGLPLAALLALGSGVLFFALFRLVWSILRGVP
jgi:eukaryotic-like serine/threonine-protein kinase